MKVFNPPSALLEKIQALPYSLFIFTVPTIDLDGSTKRGTEGVSAIISFLKDLLQIRFKEKFTIDSSQIITGDIFGELLANAVEHGNKYNPQSLVEMGISLGEKGIMFAFRDEGDFFTKEETKKKFESRSGISSTRIESPSGHGIRDNLFIEAEDIVVSTNENALYVTLLV